MTQKSHSWAYPQRRPWVYGCLQITYDHPPQAEMTFYNFPEIDVDIDDIDRGVDDNFQLIYW